MKNLDTREYDLLSCLTFDSCEIFLWMVSGSVQKFFFTAFSDDLFKKEQQ